MTGAEPETPFFSANERQWVAAKWALIRDAQINADKSVANWRRVNDEVMDYLKRAGITDPAQIAEVKGANLQLSDYLSRGQWYRAEAQGHIADVNLFLRLKEYHLL